MNILFFIIPLALAVSGLFLALFIRAVFKGQYDNLEIDDHVSVNEGKSRETKNQPPG